MVVYDWSVVFNYKLLFDASKFHSILYELRKSKQELIVCRGGKGCISTLKFLLDLSAKSDLLLDICNEAGNTALHLAVNNQDVIAAELLVKHGADVSVKNINFQTPVDCIPLDLEDNKMKKLLSLLKI